jgi:5-methylcytosine-specific restriction endonuclease McrA
MRWISSLIVHIAAANYKEKEYNMNLSFLPSIINDAPTRKYVRDISTQKIKFMKIAMKVATNIYIRCRLSEAQNWKCCWCGVQCVTESNQSNSATIEHIQPRSLGGADEQENYAMACSRCNNKRGTLSVESMLAKILHVATKDKETQLAQQERTVERKIRTGLKLAARGWKKKDGTSLCQEEWIKSLKLPLDIKNKIIVALMSVTP